MTGPVSGHKWLTLGHKDQPRRPEDMQIMIPGAGSTGTGGSPYPVGGTKPESNSLDAPRDTKLNSAVSIFSGPSSVASFLPQDADKKTSDDAPANPSDGSAAVTANADADFIDDEVRGRKFDVKAA